jgi:hypothetical protein
MGHFFIVRQMALLTMYKGENAKLSTAAFGQIDLNAIELGGYDQ